MARIAGPDDVRRAEAHNELVDTVASIMFAGPDTDAATADYRPSSADWLLAAAFVEHLRRRGYRIVTDA